MVPGHHPRAPLVFPPLAHSPHLLCECFSRVQLLPGSSVHGDSPSKNTAVGCHALLQGILPTQGLNTHISYTSGIGRWVLYH